MRQSLMAIVASAALGSLGLMTGPAVAQAAPVQAAPIHAPAEPGAEALAALRDGELATAYMQRRGHVAYRGGGYRGAYRGGYRGRAVVARPYYGRRAYYGGYPYGYYRRPNYGAAAAAGAVGLATGAIVGGALAQQQAPVYVAPNQGSVAYCSQRYRSYDPASGTYLGYDGLRHPCP